MNELMMQNHFRKVNKTMITLCLFLVAVIVFFALVQKEPETLGTAIIYLAMAAAIEFSVIKDKYHLAIAYFVTISTSCIAVFLMTDYTMLYYVLIPASMAVLYLNKSLFITCSIFLNIAIIAKLFFIQELDTNSISSLFTVDIIIATLFIISNWGTDMIKSVAENSGRGITVQEAAQGIAGQTGRINQASTMTEGGAACPAAQATKQPASGAASTISPDILSERERQILLLYARGYSCREIGMSLSLANSTVESYKSRITDKLGIRKRYDFLEYATEYDLFNEENKE